MRAIVWTRYGPPEVLQLKEVPKPVPKDNEVLIKVHATTVTLGDCEMRNLKFSFLLRFLMRMFNGVTRPKRITILGQELAGEIESVGKDVKSFKKGDKIVASAGFNMGAYAEYNCLPEDNVMTIKPANMAFEEAAAIPLGGLESLHFLGRANIQKGERVLINGAGGSIGTAGIQLAKYYGAEVTGVDSGKKLEMLRSIGADHVVDYRKEDFTKRGETYDVIFDVVGKSPYSRSIKILRENGRYLLANPKGGQKLRGRLTSMSSSKKVISRTSSYEKDGLEFLKRLIEAGKLTTVIDRRYPLEQMVEAHRYVEAGGKKGNVIITVDHNSKST
jgi:NADPH:quinone reductase-like Zn-dependent oxidoreductase